MQTLLLLATSQGLVTCQRQGNTWRETRRSLEEHALTSVIAREGVILAGARQGVFRSDDLGKNWVEASKGLSTPYVRWLAYHPDISDFELAGTEPAGIFISRDGAQSWREIQEVARMRQEYGWSLPYSPAAGCVRGFAVNGSRLYAAVEDGAVLVSIDQGKNWRLADGSRGRPLHQPPAGVIHSDVHSIAVHPSSADLVYAPTGGGFFTSRDGGASWTNMYPNCYCRAVWVDPLDPDHLILGPADGVDVNGRIERTVDGGQTWAMASNNLPVPWSETMVERFAQVGAGEQAELMAVLSDGRLLSAPLATLDWRQLLPGIEDVAAVTTMED
jgi:photosystem II stability/assembly factor-like uncharacterized protein